MSTAWSLRTPRNRAGWVARCRVLSATRDRGSAAVQAVMILPLMITLLFVGMQAALFYWGRTVAIVAAEEGARVAALEDGSTSEGIANARSFVTGDGGSDVLEDVSVTGARSPTQATVTVSGVVLSVIPGWSPQITHTASFPVERLTGGR